MKKALSLLLALVLCLSLCACSDPQDTQPQVSDSNNTESSGNSTNTESSTSQPEEPLIIESFFSGRPSINTKRFHELVETVELTTENWMDYIEVCSYTKKTITRDAFGEITSEETTICYELGAKGDKYYHFREFVIELKHKTTGETRILGDVSNSDHGAIMRGITEEFSLEEYECTRIKGTLYLIDVPAEVIFESDTGYREFFVGLDDGSWHDYSLTIAGVDGRGIGGMFCYLFYC